MKILQTRTFKNQVKKLHKNQKQSLDEAITKIKKDPLIGIPKKGDLSGIRVYKFKMIKHLILLAYEFHKNDLSLILLSLGSHENFYKNLN